MLTPCLYAVVRLAERTPHVPCLTLPLENSQARDALQKPREIIGITPSFNTTCRHLLRGAHWFCSLERNPCGCYLTMSLSRSHIPHRGSKWKTVGTTPSVSAKCTWMTLRRGIRHHALSLTYLECKSQIFLHMSGYSCLPSSLESGDFVDPSDWLFSLGLFTWTCRRE